LPPQRRFFGYGIFGALAGAAGGLIPEHIRNLLSFGAFTVLGIVLVYYGIRGGHFHTACPTKSAGRYITNPILLGFLTRLELCPPFLLAIARAASTGGALGGTVFFLGFFAGTSIFLVPTAFFGIASQVKFFRVLAAIASVAVGIWFFAQGASGLVLETAGRTETGENYSVIGIPDAPQVWIVSDIPAGDSLAAVLDSIAAGEIFVISPAQADSLARTADTLSLILWIGEDVPKKISARFGVIQIPPEKVAEHIGEIANFLGTYYFKRRHGQGFVFKIRL